ncbi:13543_t:CDS:1, partial [Racocetra persica]
NNPLQQKAEILNIIKVMDSSYISRDAYRNLAAINFHLLHEYIVVNEQMKLTQEMTNKIQINLINMNKAINNINSEEEESDTDTDIDTNEINRSEFIDGQ